MRGIGWTATVMILSALATTSTAKLQQLDLGHQMPPGFVVAPSPMFATYRPPAYQPPPVYQPAPSYQPSTPQLLPSYGGGLAGSTFRPRH
jgi:hypothetical protein